MIELLRNNIIIRNVDEESDSYRKLRNRFSVWDNVSHKYTFSAFININKDIYIPASVGIKEIQGLFPDKTLNETKITSKAKKIEYQMKNQPRDDLQRKAVTFLSSMKNSKQREKFLGLHTGAGKTYIITNIGSVFKKRIMVIVDTISLAEQWKEQFLYHTTLKEDEIGIISGQESAESEMKKSNKSVYICIHRTLSNMIDEDKNSMNTMIRKLGIGVRVFDEAHVEFKNICYINALSNVDYTIYLTATPGRSKFTDNSLYSKIFGKIPFFNGKENDDIGNYHTVLLHKYKSNPGIGDKAKIKTKYGFSLSRWANYIFDNEYENFAEDLIKLIKNLKLIENNRKTIIMLPTLNLLKALKTDLEEEFKITVGTFIGEIKKEEQRKEELSHTLILTNDKIFDKAIDVPGLEVLISYIQLSSQIKLEQIIGRLRYQKGKQSVMIDVADYGFQETINNLKIRKRFYKKKAKKIIELSS